MAFDLSKLKEKNENQKLLVKKEEPIIKVAEKKLKPKKSGKVGRPTIEKEPLNHPLTINFTEKEYVKIKEKAGLAPMTGYMRDVIKNAGII